MAESPRAPRRSFLPLTVVLATVLLAWLLAARSAEAVSIPPTTPPYGAPIEKFRVFPSTTQAGAHPDTTIEFEVGTRYSKYPVEEPSSANTSKNIIVKMPQGFIANPHAVAECSAAQFALNECPADAQVGLVHAVVTLAGGYTGEIEMPLYNLAPQPGQAGLLGFKGVIFGYPVYTVIHPRTEGDYGLTAEVPSISNTFGIHYFRQELWGVPASPIHDAQRYKKGGALPEAGPEISNLPERPFLSNPTTCLPDPLTGQPFSELITQAYDHVEYKERISWPVATGCDQLNFNPSQAAKPSTEAADSASGLDTLLHVPQNESPTTPSDSEIKAVITTLPAGFSINSSSADGKVSCTFAQSRYGTSEEGQCPEQSKIGTVTLDSLALPAPIHGGIYIGEPVPGNRYRLFLTADGYGTHVKLKADVHPDPLTGRLTTVFKDLPQSPYDEFDLHFYGSERGLLATPTKCGTYAVETEFEPWATGLGNQISTQFFSITSGPGGSPCPGATRSFAPVFRAVGAGSGSGAHSPFSIYVARNDGEQTLSTIGVKTPPGFSATLKGIPYCSEATIREIENESWTGNNELATPKCPAASQVGVSWAAAGAGSKPFNSAGRVYLSGPYKGAPLSFTVVTPAVAGPYDLGNVVNRVAIKVDPVTAQVTATSDPLPQILAGIPLRVRSVLINLNRDNFTLNPTNCNPFQVNGALGGSEGGSTTPSGLFQVANCDGLGFEPKLKTVLKGGTKRTAHPALTATLTQDPSGESNISRAVVTLPKSEFLDQSHIGTVCTRVQFAAKQCPAASIYGHATATTPLLDQPLSGPVYLRSSNHTLPDLVAALRGPASQPIEIDLAGRIDSKGGGIRASFESIPDQPVSKFVLSMKGGKKGLLQNSTNICKGTHITKVRMVGQNGAVINPNTPLEAKCGGSARTKRAKRAGGKSGGR
ncbi:MAG TPA: hypothetical protein VN522_01920 [Solirubrobacterales bacterium]|nr:hypothetical protein [Solirubrobacterales bacterium]